MHSPSHQKSVGTAARLIPSGQSHSSQNAHRFSWVPHCDESCDTYRNCVDQCDHPLKLTGQTKHFQSRRSPHLRPCFSPLPDSRPRRNPRLSLLGQPSLGRLSPVNRWPVPHRNYGRNTPKPRAFYLRFPVFPSPIFRALIPTHLCSGSRRNRWFFLLGYLWPAAIIPNGTQSDPYPCTPKSHPRTTVPPRR